MYDVIIIGRGPAGLSAAIYLSRAGRKVLVIGNENQIWNDDVRINNFFGVGDITGRELMDTGQGQAERFGAEIIDSLVTKIETLKDWFIIFAEKEYKTKNLLIATGASRKKNEISNEADFIGRGVSYCVACDAFFFKNKKVIVVGSRDFALMEAKELLDYTKDVVLCTNGEELSFDEKELKKSGIKLLKDKIIRISGDKKVEALETSNGLISVDGVFIAVGDIDANDLSRMMGLMTDDGKIKVDENCKTNAEFVWAAGDCTKGVQQVSTAVGKGAVAASNIIKEGRR